MSVHHEANEPSTEERRSFLGIISGLIAAGITAVLGINLGRFTLGPALAPSAGAADWTEAGALADIPDGKLIKRNIIVAQEAGWGKFVSERAIFVLKKGNDLTVFTAVCPHLGCTIQASAEKFLCACHNSQFDQSGTMLSGVAPRGMDTLEHLVEEGKLKVRYQNFKQGIPAKEVIG
jgi:menaquinol-cytochrome c reductase iron-sulfur subunit